MRKEAIEEEGIEDNQAQREYAGDTEGDGNGDSLVLGVGVLEGGVGEGEVLVEGFDAIEDPEADYTCTASASVRFTLQVMADMGWRRT